jgi:hypothetical protein
MHEYFRGSVDGLGGNVLGRGNAENFTTILQAAFEALTASSKSKRAIETILQTLHSSWLLF